MGGFCSFPHLILSVILLLYKNYFGSCTYHIYHKYITHFCLVSFHHVFQFSSVAQLCPTLCNPIDCSPPGPSVHGVLQARTPEWVAISFSKRNYIVRNKVKSLSGVRPFATPWTVAHQAPPSMEFPSQVLEWVASSVSSQVT